MTMIANTVSILVATLGRPTLERTLASITSQMHPGDQVIVIGATQAIGDRAVAQGCTFVHCPPGKDWGATERTVAMGHTTGTYVAFLDDDDVYLPGARDAMEVAMRDHPAQPTIFRMQIARTGELLWREPVAKMGNMGTPMMFLPNDARTHRGTWGRKYGNDFAFFASLRWPTEAIVWDSHVIASIRP